MPQRVMFSRRLFHARYSGKVGAKILSHLKTLPTTMSAAQSIQIMWIV